MTEMSAKVVVLDRVLAHYGPETQEARDLLRGAVVGSRDRMWPQEGAADFRSGTAGYWMEAVLDQIQALSPKDDVQRSLRGQALSMGMVSAKPAG